MRVGLTVKLETCRANEWWSAFPIYKYIVHVLFFNENSPTFVRFKVVIIIKGKLFSIFDIDRIHSFGSPDGLVSL